MKKGLQAPRGHWGLHHNDPPSPLNLEQDGPFGSERSFPSPLPARTAFPAHPPLLHSLLFLLVSLGLLVSLSPASTSPHPEL